MIKILNPGDAENLAHLLAGFGEGSAVVLCFLRIIILSPAPLTHPNLTGDAGAGAGKLAQPARHRADRLMQAIEM